MLERQRLPIERRCPYVPAGKAVVFLAAMVVVDHAIDHRADWDVHR